MGPRGDTSSIGLPAVQKQYAIGKNCEPMHRKFRPPNNKHLDIDALNAMLHFSAN